MDNSSIIIMFDNRPTGDDIFVGKKYKGMVKLTLRLGKANNKTLKKALEYSYDNTIIIDNRKEYLLVIDQMPLHKYFNAIEKDDLQFYDDIQVVHWTNKKLQKYIDLSINRTEWKKLNDLNELNNLKLFKEDKEKDETNLLISIYDNNEVSYEKAPLYDNYLYNKYYI